MITKLIVKNFKVLDDVEIEIGNPVVFIGPNNSGKTSALQVLALWDIGLKRWNEKRKGAKTTEKRSGVTINRRDLISVPVPDANLLWNKLHVRDVQRNNGKQTTENIRIEIIVEGVSKDKSWECGLEFDYANMESLYCRPLRIGASKTPQRMLIPKEAGDISIAFLPPMSGLAANESRLDPGAINVRIGEGRTADVLRNLCYTIYEKDVKIWEKLTHHIDLLFGVKLDEPQYIQERGEIVMSFRQEGLTLDLSASGRGLQQTLLLLAYMYSNPGAVLLLDEPDAHLEILRQRQIYNLITNVAAQNNSQIIIASHSEILLNEAADKDVVVAFLGKPHRINDRGSQLLKSLKDIGFEDYYLSQQKGWVLYLEGSTDLSILQSFAEILGHSEAIKILERPFVHYVGNQLQKAKDHFYGLREGVLSLRGIAVFDKLDQAIPEDTIMKVLQWQRREIENYLCTRDVLSAYAKDVEHKETAVPLFSEEETVERIKSMDEAINEVTAAMETLGKGSPWDHNTKVSDDFLPHVFDKYFKKLKLPNVMLKKNYHILVKYVSKDKIASEITEKLNDIVATAKKK
ncbi:MAG: AAA family ATPase [Candidatus Omnitrophica bacterium]|nr:AAA family ATPase [Candidatus Omnitrophota bacterium]MBU4478048.1 AAA family ATPase [Candidatus Omnitrophota bacterium]